MNLLFNQVFYVGAWKKARREVYVKVKPISFRTGNGILD
jgi:hypothetical protein